MVLPSPPFSIYKTKMHLQIDVSYNQVATAANAKNIKSTSETPQQFLLEAPVRRAPLICLSAWLQCPASTFSSSAHFPGLRPRC